MNILLVTEFFSKGKKLRFTGGVEARTYYLSQQLKKSHHVSVISRSKKNISASISSLLSRVFFLFSAVIKGTKSNPDVIEGSNFVSYLPAWVLAKLKRVPAVAWYPDVFANSWQRYFGPVGIFGQLIEKISLKLTWDHIIALSQQTKKKLINQGIASDKITVVYPGVDKSIIQSIKVEKYSLPTVCCISRLVNYKRISDLIKALPLIHQNIPQCRLIIIGSGPELKNLHQLARDLKVSKSIFFKNNLPRTKLLKLLKRSHLHCLPSVVEGFGLVTLEALAGHTPYINADTPINCEVTRGGKGGLLFKSKSPKDLSQKIINLLTDKKLYRSTQLQGKKLLSHYSWSQSAADTIKVYRSVLR